MLKNQALHRLFEQVRGGSFAATYRDGKTEHYGNGEPQFTVRIKDDNVLGLIGDDMLTSFGEAYMDGLVNVGGDLADLLCLALRSGLMSVTQKPQGFAGAALRAAGKLCSLKREKENIARHYDLGNDFFRLWLDESLTYSCAYFRRASDTLEHAQRQKIDHSLKKLRLQTGDTLLDIGCGWGELVFRAAEHYGAEATGITLSEEQHAGANAAIKSRGLQGTVSVRLADYGVLPDEGKQFDKILSIGMIENLAPHYRLTLYCWSERFERVVPAVLEKFNERFVRMWRLYLRASSAAFREGAVEVHQILVSRGQATDLPLTREDIYAGDESHAHR